MKLITLLTLMTTCSANELGLQTFNQPQYPFPLHFQTPQGGSFVTENNVYLPPDMHSPMPYFAQKNPNDLQYQYLPPSGSKAPAQYPPPFPMFSTTFRPNTDEDDEDDDDEDDSEALGSSAAAPHEHRLNQSQNSPGPQVEIPNRPIPKAIPYFSPVDRIDTKYPAQSGVSIPMNTNTPPFNYQTNMNRRTIQPAGFVGSPNQNDQMMIDQMKTGSHPGHHYVPPPQGYSNPTPEPVPILRLSNEMDLDGSYSYEALSGDQTHMTQHGHVENLGTDHAENVVEGSYSYVGDNGQTYTVHYIADGNGFRASGDHLPVAPPIPEIIQRSIEYNMAEESSKPPHLQNNYHSDDKHNNPGRNHNYQPTLPSLPQPSRNLFTGRQPEAFSHNHNGATSSQSNNLQQAASTQTPVLSYEAPKEPPPRMISAPISPQITFLASQGAHDPSESIKRMYTPPNYEEPVFRFGNLKNKDQPQPNYQRIPWQYQNPFLSNAVTKATPTKNFISRSSLEQEDDVMINFSEMTPEQYSRLYHSQIKPKEESNNYDDPKNIIHTQKDSNVRSNYEVPNNEHNAKLGELGEQNQVTEDYKHFQLMHLSSPQNWHGNIKNTAQSDNYITNIQTRTMGTGKQRSSLITKDDFTPPSQTITSSYDTYRSDIQSARQMEFNTNKTTSSQREHVPLTTQTNYGDDSIYNIYNTTQFTMYMSTAPIQKETESEINLNYESSPVPSTIKPHIQKIQPVSNSYTENISKPDESYEIHDSYSIHYEPEIQAVQKPTEDNFDDILKTNIFLKNIIVTNDGSRKNANNTFLKTDENWRPSLIQSQQKKIEEKKEKKENKKYYTKAIKANDFNETKRKSIDISQIANLVTLKNYFESNKIKPRQKQGSNSGTIRFSHEKMSTRNKQQESQDQKSLSQASNENNSYKIHKAADFSSNNYSPGKSEDYDRMIGVAKIYKTLQRNSKLNGNGSPQLRSELMPPMQDYNVMSLHRAQPGLPPLGRAGPSMKSYLPPIFS